MRLSRVFTDQALSAGATVALDDRASHHLGQVLRLRPGDQIRLFNGSGHDFAAVLTDCGRKACSARILEIASTEPAAALELHLGMGLSRGERMDFALQKSVELGVTAITPLKTERSVVDLRGERLRRRSAHWQGIVINACEQSGRSRVPVLHAPVNLDDWLISQGGGLMLHHRSRQTLAGLAPPETPLNLLVGPEGGLSDAERARAVARGFVAVRLGPRVLRTETAPLAALAAIQTLWGDFRD
jgi:16S rRNA (uracil1498-N3)-methyltransferase